MQFLTTLLLNLGFGLLLVAGLASVLRDMLQLQRDFSRPTGGGPPRAALAREVRP